MKSIYKIGLIVCTITLSNCNSEHDDIQNDTLNITQDTEDVTFNTSFDQSRFSLINRTIAPQVVKKNTSTSRRSVAFGAQNSNNNDANVINQQPYYWYWVAKIDAPSFGGHTLSSTHCDIIGNRAYVSYHVQGDVHKGALEIVDITDPNSPSLISQMRFNNADINAIKVENEQNIWLAGAHEKHGAVVFKVNATTNAYERINISNRMRKNGGNGVSASANGVDYTNNYLIVTSGKTHGGTIVLDKNTYDVVSYDKYSSAKYTTLVSNDDNSRYASLITGDNATIKTGTINNLVESSTDINAGEITHINVERTYRGKNTLEFSPFTPDRVYASLGQSGLKVFDINTGEQTNESRGLMLLEGNTNAVTLDDTYMYIANGADGISIGEHISDGKLIDPLFAWDEEEMPASANYVIAQNNYIFVCKGLGGFNILYRQEKQAYMTATAFDSNTGKPLGMEPDEAICDGLLSTIFSEVLPERENAIVNHPEYFTHATKNISVKETTEVSVTFLHEGAGYKNIFGYYAYPENNPPQRLEDIVRIVVFPNASAQRSGGDLIPGNTVALLGEFDAGTEIGFFVIADGWNNRRITDGRGIQHSDKQFNKNTAQQSIIFYDQACNTTYICFEDISIPNGDKDYNDLILQINSSNPNGIDPNDYIQID